MGFLLGAFGKLMAGRRVRDLQARMMRVQSKARRTTRQIEKMSKMLETQKKMEINNLAMQQQAGNSMMPYLAASSATAVMQAAAAKNGTTFNGPSENAQALAFGGASLDSFIQNGGLTKEDQSWMAQFSNVKTQMSSSTEMWLAQMKNQIEEKYENMNDIMLEPLKMEEDSLQTEKDSLESQLQIAQADYEACKKMEQADAKNLAPNYTGQG